MEIYELGALELGRKIKQREISVAEVVQASLEQIRKKEPQYHCYLTIDEEGAKKRSALVQKQIDEGTFTGPLAGVPAALKDNLCTKGLKTDRKSVV